MILATAVGRVLLYRHARSHGRRRNSSGQKNSRGPRSFSKFWNSMRARYRKWLPRLAAGVVIVASAAAAGSAETVRIATFNLSLYGQNGGEVLARLQSGDDAQAKHLAEIIQRARPDVILLNEIDDDPRGEVLNAFC